MKQIERFTFEYVPESSSYARYASIGTMSGYENPFPPLVKIRVVYGSRQYGLSLATHNDERALTETFLEYLLRHAIAEFRKCINKEADEKARKALEARQAEFVKAADDYKNRAVGS